MIIYLDESKRLAEGKIIYGGFITDHNTHYLTKTIKGLKKDFLIDEHIELKSISKYGEIFINNFINTKAYYDLEIKTFGFCFDNYKDSIENYIKILLQTLNIIHPYFNYYKQTIHIIADKITVNNLSKTQKEIEILIKEKLKIKGKITFNFENSKNYYGLQLADLIVGKFKEFYFFDDIKYLDDFVNNKKIGNYNFNKFNHF